MYRIVPAIESLEQHLRILISNPERYRPTRCPYCGLGTLWCHGYYERKADRGSGVLNPIAVPRFLCAGCKHTCSRLPSCIAPLRWYDWAMQQAVLLSVLLGQSPHVCAKAFGVGRRTVTRWWRWLEERTEEFEFHLRSRFIEWGRAVGWRAFWQLAFSQQPLRELMAWLDQQGLTVP